MEDLTSWVSRQAQNMGIDFSCLSSRTRDQIISTLMSGLENGFRSRMDSPDLRFAKRRGIGGEKFNNKYELKQTSSYIYTIDSSTCRNSGSACVDLSCTHSGDNCIDYEGCIDGPCTNNASAQSPGCYDEDSCTDQMCKNNYKCTDTRMCRDISCSDASICSDVGDDIIKCADVSSCTNQSCTDDNCKDIYCNNAQEGAQCTDIQASCLDSRCQNKNCQDSHACIDS